MVPVYTFFIAWKLNCQFLNASLCVYLCVCRERCGVIKIRQPGVQRHWRERETVFQNGPAGLRRLTRKRYIDLGNEHTHCDRIWKAPNNKLTWQLPALWMRRTQPTISKHFGINQRFAIWLFFVCVCVPSCRWGRSGPCKEQVRCTGLWHTA